MSNIFTRKALNDIMGNEGLTPEQRTEQVFSLYLSPVQPEEGAEEPAA
jgi:hypothetical protein